MEVKFKPTPEQKPQIGRTKEPGCVGDEFSKWNKRWNGRSQTVQNLYIGRKVGFNLKNLFEVFVLILERIVSVLDVIFL